MPERKKPASKAYKGHPILRYNLPKPVKSMDKITQTEETSTTLIQPETTSSAVAPIPSTKRKSNRTTRKQPMGSQELFALLQDQNTIMMSNALSVTRLTRSSKISALPTLNRTSTNIKKVGILSDPLSHFCTFRSPLHPKVSALTDCLMTP